MINDILCMFAGAFIAFSLTLANSTCAGRACIYVYGLPTWFPIWW